VLVRPPGIFVEAGICAHEDVWWVRKALYGLREAPQAWSVERDARLREAKGGFKFQQALSDANVWLIRREEDGEHHKNSPPIGLIVCYVDDMLIMGPRKIAEQVVKIIQSMWEVSRPEYLEEGAIKFCGLKISRSKQEEKEKEVQRSDEKKSYGIMISQGDYAKEILKRNDMLDANGSKIVLDHDECKNVGEEATEDKEAPIEEVRLAQRLVGELNWLQKTRCDLSYAISRSAAYMQKNPQRSTAMAKKVLRYLRHSFDDGIHYMSKQELKEAGKEEEASQFKEQYEDNKVISFTDISYAPEGAKSHGCIMVAVAGGLVFWKSGKQELVTLSTAEAELHEACKGVTALSSVQEMVEEFTGKKFEKVLAIDNKAAIVLANPVTAQSLIAWRTRHLRVRAHFLAEQIENSEVSVAHCPGIYQWADIGTKTLTAAVLNRLKKLIGMKKAEIEKDERMNEEVKDQDKPRMLING
jgi:hypothetical protein